MKRKMIILIIMIMILPTIANARTYEEAEEITYELGIANNSDGSCSYYAESIPFETIIANDCALTFEQYVSQNSWLEGKTTAQKQSYYNKDQNECKSGVVFDIITLDYQDEKWANQNDISFNYDSNDSTLDIAVKYNDQNATFSRTCKITFDNIDTTIVNEGKKLVNNIEKNYKLYGLDSIVYQYHVPKEPFTKANLFMFKDFRNFLFNSIESVDVSLRENISFDIHANPYADTLITGNAGYGTPVVYYQGTIIATKRNRVFDFTHVVPVDKSLSGTTLQKAQKELELLFGKDVQFEIIPDEIQWDDALNDEINYRLGTTNVEYIGLSASIKLENQTIYSVFFVELDQDKVERYEATALDKTTGIRVKTNSYDIPSDIALFTEDAMTSENVRKAVKENYSLLSAYNIHLLNYISSFGRISEIKNGLRVYIPANDRDIGEKLLVHHIKEDGTLGDSFDGLVVELDGKKYVEFTTTHLSTFAVYKQKQQAITPPETGRYIAFFGLILLMISGMLIHLKNKPFINKI